MENESFLRKKEESQINKIITDLYRNQCSNISILFHIFWQLSCEKCYQLL